MMKLVMGLGNPGEQYKSHRHNVGYMILDRLAKKLDVDLNVRKKKTVFGKGKHGKMDYLLLKPLTFMNLSGEAALYMASFMKISVEDIIVIYDDMNIPIGSFKVQVGGSDGGHNGVKSIAQSLKSDNFTRIRVGIGRPPQGDDVSDFVLSPFLKLERCKLRAIFEDVVESCKVSLLESPIIAMNRFNKRIASQSFENCEDNDDDDSLV